MEGLTFLQTNRDSTCMDQGDKTSIQLEREAIKIFSLKKKERKMTKLLIIVACYIITPRVVLKSMLCN